MAKTQEQIRSKIWQEEAEPDNPFAAKICRCHGYDVYGDLLGQISWAEYLYLLFVGEAPTKDQAHLLEDLAIILANPGIRDHSVRAAMNGGVGGSASASCLMAALGVGAGNLAGGHEIAVIIEAWQDLGQNLANWQKYFQLQPYQQPRNDTWHPLEHPPGFDATGVNCTTPVRLALNHFAKTSGQESHGYWLQQHRLDLESWASCPLAMSGLAATVMVDLGLSPKQGEMLYLLLRLPGAAVHALEQQQNGWRRYPFFMEGLTVSNDPGPKVELEEL